jgi:CRP-like cAMP-binding protein
VATGSAALGHFIRSVPLFSLVEDGDLEGVLRLLRPVELRPGEVLFREGEPGKAMWVLGAGAEVSISQTHGGTRAALEVARARLGEVVGEMALVDDGPRSGTATVLRGGAAHELDAREFNAMRAAFVPGAFKVLRKLCIDLCLRLRQTNERIVPSGHVRVETPPWPAGPRPEVEQLERFPPFRRLPAVVKLALAQKLEAVQVAELTPLFAEGEASDGAWFLVEGEVSVGRNGKTLANLPAGTMFGQVACIDNQARSASCLTTGPALLFRMVRRDFELLFASGHRFAFQLVDLVARQLVQHLRDANALLPQPGLLGGATAGVATAVRSMLHAEPGPEDLDLLSTELEVETALPIEIELDLGEFVPESGLLS